jgi:hypothetical protein
MRHGDVARNVKQVYPQNSSNLNVSSYACSKSRYINGILCVCSALVHAAGCTKNKWCYRHFTANQFLIAPCADEMQLHFPTLTY